MPLDNMEGLRKVDLSGGIGGLFAGIRNEQSQRENEQLIREQKSKADLAGLMTTRQEQLTPWEVALKQNESRLRGGEADLKTNPEYIAGQVAESVGTGKVRQAEGDVAKATTQSTIAVTKAKQDNTTSLLGAIDFRNKFEEAMTSVPKSDDPAVYNESVITALTAYGIADHPMSQQYLSKPLQARQSFLPSFDKMLSARMARQPDVAAKIMEIEATGKWHKEVAAMHERTSKYATDAREKGADNRSMIQLQHETTSLLNNMRTNARAQWQAETSGDGPLSESRQKIVWLEGKNSNREKGTPLVGPQMLTRNYQNGKFLVEFTNWYDKKKRERSDSLREDVESYEQYLMEINAAVAQQKPEKRQAIITKAIEDLQKRQSRKLKQDTKDESQSTEPKPKPITRGGPIPTFASEAEATAAGHKGPVIINGVRGTMQ